MTLTIRRRLRYVDLADHLQSQILKGTLRAGEKAPSVRRLSRQRQVSITTVLQAYYLLENRGYLAARARSGFFTRLPRVRPPQIRAPLSSPTNSADVNNLLSSIISSFSSAKYFALGAAAPNPDLLPRRRLNLIIRRIARHNPTHSDRYEFPPGSAELRHAIARRSIAYGFNASEDELIITTGAMEGLNLALRAVAKPGDLIAIESPTYFGILQIIESLGMKALEITTTCGGGLDVSALAAAIAKYRIKACLVSANCQNPLGFVMRDDAKRALVDLLTKHRIPLIEDDIYGDLAFGMERPRPAKAFDRDDYVILCSSTSKTMQPGLRVGWVQSRRYFREICDLKYLTTVATPSLSQAAVAEFMNSGGYDRHVNKLRHQTQRQLSYALKAVSDSFPDGTCATQPAGGFLLWVELPRKVRSRDVYRRALKAGISIVPGDVCSPRQRFNHHLRINCAHPRSLEFDTAVAEIGRICRELNGAR
jgi:DNA-binding transcriptional MocR family regulator